MRKKIVFVICNGRSGSTVFSKFLGAHSNCFALSEPHYFDTHFNDCELCSCEKTYEKCDFWNAVVADIGIKKEDIGRFNTSSIPFTKTNEGKIKKIIKYLNLFVFTKFKIPYLYKDYFSQIENEIKLLESVMHLREEKIFIDASKGLTRAIFIMSVLGSKYDYSFIFLERNINNVINSMTKNKVKIELSNGSTKETESNSQMDKLNAEKQIKSVTKHNKIMRKIFNLDVTYVNYEGFIKDPHDIFVGLKKMLSINWEETMLNLNEGDHHLLGGNYSRINARTIRSNGE
jgi:hypothetical protein